MKFIGLTPPGITLNLGPPAPQGKTGGAETLFPTGTRDSGTSGEEGEGKEEKQEGRKSKKKEGGKSKKQERGRKAKVPRKCWHLAMWHLDHHI